MCVTHTVYSNIYERIMKVRIDNNVNIFTLTDFLSINSKYRLSYKTDRWINTERELELIRNENNTLTISYNSSRIRSLIATISGVKVKLVESELNSLSFNIENADKYLFYLLDNKKDLYLYGNLASGGGNDQ